MNTTPSANDRATYYYSKLTDLLEDYSESKEAIILSEKFDPDGEISLAPLNELRSAFDHIMRACSFPEEVDKQFEEAQSHIRRAGYDAYELFNANIIEDQIKSLKRFKSQVIAHVFPEYYTTIIPTYNNIKKDIAAIRAHSKIISAANHHHFEKYFEKSKSLIDLSNLISSKIPGLEAYSKQLKKENRISHFWYWSITIGLAAACLILGLLLG